jgi:2-dehydro-3-deoxygalactonokinase
VPVIVTANNTMNSRSLLAIDWGTSSLRGAWLDARGHVVEERAFPRGILTVSPETFPRVFQECFGDWMARPGALCLMSGMVGSQQGWQQAPYCPCPAGFDQIAANLSWVEPGRLAIVPGLRWDHAGIPGHEQLAHIPDVMRGEETQVFGALRLLGLSDAQLVLPGTHSKWVRVRQGAITSFSTWMTGEVYALLRQHSILARSMPASPADEAFHPDAFSQGIALARQQGSLLSTAFSTRTLSLFERLPSAVLPSYLSGLVIGEELRAQVFENTNSVIIIGSEALTQRYQSALSQYGVTARCVGAAATWTGLWAIAQTVFPTLTTAAP